MVIFEETIIEDVVKSKIWRDFSSRSTNVERVGPSVFFLGGLSSFDFFFSWLEVILMTITSFLASVGVMSGPAIYRKSILASVDS